MKKNNKGMTLGEVVISVLIISMLIFSIYSILILLISYIHDEIIYKKINETRISIYTDIGRLIKDKGFTFSKYKYSDFLDENKKYIDTNFDPNLFIKTEEKFRKQIKEILNNDGITLNGGRIYGVLDEKLTKQNEGGTIDLSSRIDDLNKLQEYGICNGVENIGGHNVCKLYNDVSSIDNNFDIIIAKKNGLIHMFYVKSGIFTQKTFSIEKDKNNNDIIDKNSILTLSKQGDVKVTSLHFNNIPQNYTYYNGINMYSNPNLVFRLCNIEYSNNDVIIGNLKCK